jgi:hypothetical protein
MILGNRWGEGLQQFVSAELDGSQQRESKPQIRFRIISWLTIIAVVIVSGVVTLEVSRGVLSEFAKVQYDDSFITYRYAANFALGDGLRFNLGEQSNSASSLLYTLMLAPLFAIWRFELPMIAQLLSQLCFMITAGLIVFAGVSARKSYLGLVAGLAAGVIWIGSPYINYWALSGMETLIFCLLLTLAIVTTQLVLRAKSESNSKLILCVSSLVLLSLVRWEGAAVALALSALLCFRGNGKNWRESRRELLLLTAPILAVTGTCAAILLFYRSYYESWIPTPVIFKRLAEYYRRDISQSLFTIRDYATSEFGTYTLILLGLAIIATLLAFINSRRGGFSFQLLAPIVSIVVLLAFLAVSASSDFYRYELALLVPCILLLAQTPELIGQLGTWTRIGRMQEIVGVGLVAALAGASVLSVVNFVPRVSAIEQTTGRFLYLQEARHQMGEFLEEATPEGSKVLSGDLGALSFYNLSNTYVDSVGLTNIELLQKLQSGERYSEIIDARLPVYAVDTIDELGILGSEQTYNNPSGYFSIDLASDGTCPFKQRYLTREIAIYPKIAPDILSVAAWELTPRNC